MDSKFVLSNSFNEVVFEHRNKAYGAYEIRKYYGQRMVVAAMLSSVATVALITAISMSEKAVAMPATPLQVERPVILLPDPTVYKQQMENNQKKDPVKPARPDVRKADEVPKAQTDIEVTTDPVKPEDIPTSTPGGSPNGTEGGLSTGSSDPGGPGSGVSGIPVQSLTPPTDCTWVPIMPENEALTNFLHANIVYPQIDKEQGNEGTVYVEFIVNADGSYKDIKVVKGVSPTIDREAIRVMRKMPKWKPGRNNEQAVAVRLTLPIAFKLQH
jgi:protein TonB